jgi:hypothetical protein
MWRLIFRTDQEAHMKAILLATAFVLAGTAVHAQQQTCKMQSASKKLAGAAEKSFMTKCENDAKAACDKAAAAKKLAGAAKASFTKKCVSDSVGS